jgi:predicted RNA-binding protein
MKRITAVLILVSFLTSCSDNKGVLVGEVETLEMQYIAWACDCANWATKDDLEKYNGDSLAEQCIFIEPANEKLELPDTLGYSMDVIRFKGQFYENKGFPRGYRSQQNPEP